METSVVFPYVFNIDYSLTHIKEESATSHAVTTDLSTPIKETSYHELTTLHFPDTTPKGLLIFYLW